MAIAVLLAVLVALLRGGSFRNLAAVPLRYAPLALIALALQVYLRTAGFKGWPLTATAAPVLFALSFLLLFWVLWNNRRLPFIWLLALGAALNCLAIFANGGRMPVSPTAMLLTDMYISDAQWAHFFSHQLMTEQTRLPWLVDIIPVRIPFLSGWWNQASPMSVGDLTEVVGMFLFVQAASRAQFPGVGMRRNVSSAGGGTRT